MPELLRDADEVAAWLHLKRETVRKYARDGVIPATKVGKRWLFRPADVERFLAAQQPSGDIDAINQALEDTDRQ